MERHLKHLNYLQDLMESLYNPSVNSYNQSQDWWEAKDRFNQVRIAWGQSFNLAVAALPDRLRGSESFPLIEAWQEYFYNKLTEPLVVGLKASYEKKKPKVPTKREQLLNSRV